MPKRVHSISPVRSNKRSKMSNQIGDDDSMGDMDQNEKRAMGPDPIHQGWSLNPGPPTYTHTVLPYMFQAKFSTNDKLSSDHTFRMTSVYDPAVGRVTVDYQSGGGVSDAIVGDPTDTKTESSGTVAYFKYYRGLYKYYSVVGCRYSITVENLSHEKMWTHLLFHNATTPPVEASNWDMLLWRGVKSKIMMPKMVWASANEVNQVETQLNTVSDNGTALTNITNGYETTNVQYQGPGIVNFSGEYRPGDYDQEIVLDTDSETWTEMDANPKLPEFLTLRVKPYDNTSVAESTSATNVATLRNFRYVVTTKLTYLVEFKELKDQIRWPVTRNPIFIEYESDPRAY